MPTKPCGCACTCEAPSSAPWITGQQWARLSRHDQFTITRILSPGHEPPRGTAPYAVPDVPEVEDPPRCTLCRRPW